MWMSKNSSAVATRLLTTPVSITTDRRLTELRAEAYMTLRLVILVLAAALFTSAGVVLRLIT